MKKFTFILLLIFSISLAAQTIQSPNKKLTLNIFLNDGNPGYSLQFGQKNVIRTSRLGIELKNLPSFDKGFSIIKIDTSEFDESWNPVWGEVKTIRNNYKELAVTLQQAHVKNRKMIVRFRLYDDGLGFRYEFPEQDNLDYFIISEEKTEFALDGDHKTFWIPGDYDTNEQEYSVTRLSEVNAVKMRPGLNEDIVNFTDSNTVQTPLMMKTDDGLYINIHEAALINYPAMNLIINKSAAGGNNLPSFILSSHLVPDAVGNKAYMQIPCNTPWRTVIVSDKAADIISSKLILNLNEPSKIEDTEWIKPQKYVGIWWEMHVGTSSWNYSDTNNVKLNETDWPALKPNGRHGATTERTKQYIDFASKHGFPGVLVEGWNIGWEDWVGNWKEEVFDFITPYPDFNVTELQKYAASKGVKLIMHHETSASASNYERRMDDAYKFMKENGYDAVKTGYVGRIIPRGEHHDSQWMVNHYIRVAEKTAKYKIMLDAHEPVRPTGLHRTYPNWLACEASRGNEYNAWSSGNKPEHETILPFTRLMGGPMDYTPGIFQIKLDYYIPGKKEHVHTTLAKQLALYVTLYSPLQMAADIPENYERFPDAFQFIKDVAVDWDDTKILEAEPGDYITIARKAKNKDEWYIGAITDEQERVSRIPLDYIEKGKWYSASIYSDAPDAHWNINPMAYQVNNYLVNSKTALNIKLAAGGGAAVSLKPATDEDMEKLKKYKK